MSDYISNYTGLEIDEGIGKANAALPKAEAAQAMIAPIEASTTASTAHAAGTYFRLNSVLYIATADISAGGTIAAGANCRVAVLGNDVSGFKSALTSGTQADAIYHLGFYLDVNGDLCQVDN